MLYVYEVTNIETNTAIQAVNWQCLSRLVAWLSGRTFGLLEVLLFYTKMRNVPGDYANFVASLYVHCNNRFSKKLLRSNATNVNRLTRVTLRVVCII